MLLVDSDIENVEWIDHIAKLRELIPSIYWLKEHLSSDDLCGAYEVWDELTNDEKSTIWSPAPTKGGILTTREREIMRSDEWAQVRNGM